MIENKQQAERVGDLKPNLNPDPYTPILEIFTSIQGEGLRIGLPSVFIRFAGCNLKCPWCDSKFSLLEKPLFSTQNVLWRIEDIKSCKEVVITGGEPLLHQCDILEIMEMIDRIVSGVTYTIETNGTIVPIDKLAFRKNVFWSVSPKLYLPKWEDAVDTFSLLKNVQFKFVIVDPQDLDKLSTVPFIQDRIIVQPDGNKKPYHYACKELAELVLFKKLNYRVLPQFHKICWNNRRNK